MLGRIDAVTEASRKIMAGDLSRRIPLSGSGDELDRLSESLNAMLARIEELMLALREVSDNIAHDLKTPLTRLRNRAEAALRDPGGAAAYRDGLVKTIEEADELIKHLQRAAADRAAGRRRRRREHGIGRSGRHRQRRRRALRAGGRGGRSAASRSPRRRA